MLNFEIKSESDIKSNGWETQPQIFDTENGKKNGPMGCDDFIKNYPLKSHTPSPSSSSLPKSSLSSSLPKSSTKTIEERSKRMQLNLGRYLYSIHAPPSNFKETRGIQQLHRVLHDLMRIVYSAPMSYLKSNKSMLQNQINTFKKKLQHERYGSSLMHKVEKLDAYLKRH